MEQKWVRSPKTVRLWAVAEDRGNSLGDREAVALQLLANAASLDHITYVKERLATCGLRTRAILDKIKNRKNIFLQKKTAHQMQNGSTVHTDHQNPIRQQNKPKQKEPQPSRHNFGAKANRIDQSARWRYRNTVEDVTTDI